MKLKAIIESSVLKESEKDYEKTLALFVKAVQKMTDQHFKKMHPNLSPNKITVTRGQKFDRIVTTRCGRDGKPMDSGAGVYCFIQKVASASGQIGDILKAASWKTPAKHSRGNIFSSEILKGVNAYGANYMR